MVLKTFQGLLNMAFKMFRGERLLRQTKMPDPQGGPGSPKKTDGAQPWIMVTLTTEKDCPCLACCQGPAQTVATVGLTALLCLSQKGLAFPSSSSIGNSLGHCQRPMLSCIVAM